MNKSFTLIEILVVIVVIGVLSAFILVGMSSITASANMSKGQAFSNSVRNTLLLNLVGEWKFDELTTAVNTTPIKDSWGTSNGVMNSDDANDKLKTGSECVSGKCIYLDGTGDYMSVASVPYTSIHGPSTVDVWFRQSSSAGVQDIFSDSCMEWGIYLSGGIVYGVAYYTVTGTSYGLNKWNHVVLTHEHPTGLTNTKIRIYVNGRMIQEGTYTITGGNNGYYDLPLALGRDTAGTPCTGTYFNGYVDEFKIYKEGLSSSQIEEEYYSGLGKLMSKSGLKPEEYINRLQELKYSLIGNE